MVFLKKRKQQDTFVDLKTGLKKTRSNIMIGMSNLLLGKKTIDNELLEAIETQLLAANVGVQATSEIISELTSKLARKKLSDPEALLQTLKQQLQTILEPCCQPFQIPESITPYVILMVGINGSGKTTTAGKLAKQLQQQGKKVMLAAGDTFRAAAVQQLQVWGERNNIPVIAKQRGADCAAVIFDAMQSAKARKIDVLIADTAGRLQTQVNLMEELKKVKRALKKLDSTAPHSVMLVLDAGIGQNAITQAEQFNAAISLTGITLTKLDGTAKGGIIFAIAKKMRIPIQFISVGEKVDSLHQFDAKEFVSALFSLD